MQETAQAAKSRSSQLEDFFSTGSRLTKGAHLVWQQFVRPGDFVIDATAGNGLDTLWLSKAVGPSGRVLSIDIQVAYATLNVQCCILSISTSWLDAFMGDQCDVKP